MNKIVSIKKTSSIFLATVLVLGTLATFTPSFMVGAQAEPFYENGYETEYPPYSQDYEPRDYPSDNSYYQSKDDSSIILKKINCNNINSNNNGVDVSLGLPSSDDAIDEDEGQETTANGWGYDERNNNKDFKFVCSNDNNNINIVEETIPPDTEESYLIVSKDVFCQRIGSITVGSNIACDRINTGPGNQPVIAPDDFTITVTGNNPSPSQFEGSHTPVVVNLGAGNYQVSETADPSVATTIAQLEASGTDITHSVIFSGDCDAMTGEGTIAEGEVQVCHLQNVYSAAQPSEGLTASNINTETSSSNINTSGGLASSFSSQPTIAQETEDSSALEKIAKLKAQWLELLP